VFVGKRINNYMSFTFFIYINSVLMDKNCRKNEYKIDLGLFLSESYNYNRIGNSSKYITNLALIGFRDVKFSSRTELVGERKKEGLKPS
jgi:hypothetical protein